MLFDAKELWKKSRQQSTPDSIRGDLNAEISLIPLVSGSAAPLGSSASAVGGQGQDGGVMEKPCCTGDPAAPGASGAATRAPKQAVSPGLWEGWRHVHGGALVQRKPGKRDPVGLMSFTQEPVPQLWGTGWASVTVIEREKLKQHSDTSHLQCWKISDSFVSFKWWCKLKGKESFTSLH